jgi:oxygen-independent coproporphyrinogen-3 oxidase
VKTLHFQHISAYHLTYEPKTVMHLHLQKGYLKQIDEEVSLEQFKYLVETTKEMGIEQYEISNFSLPGFHSRHNSSYWKLVPYLGLGPSAHSFDGKSRYWNIANVDTYISKVNEGKPQIQSEVLSKADLFNEYIMISFRTNAGIDLNYVTERFGEVYLKDLLAGIQTFIDAKKVDRVGERLVATLEGYFISDKIISDLFYIE